MSSTTAAVYPIGPPGRPMLNETSGAKPKRETWKDWLPPGVPEPSDLITREELLEAANAEGLDVGVYDLENWQQNGIIPYGIRRRHQGATRTLYPRWMVTAIRRLRNMQEHGYKLQQIAPRIRMLAEAMLSAEVLGWEGAEVLQMAQERVRQSPQMWNRRIDDRPLLSVEAPPYAADIGDLLAHVGDLHEGFGGLPVVRVMAALRRAPDGSTERLEIIVRDERGVEYVSYLGYGE